MNKTFSHLALSALLVSISSTSFANGIISTEASSNTPIIGSIVAGDDTEHHSIRIGFEGGFSEPLKRAFIDKGTQTRISLKRSPTYTGIIGYEFATGMYLEASAAHHNKFKVGIKLPNEQGLDNTKASANIYMLSLNYDLPALKIANTITPYVVLGAGLAQVKIKEVEVKHPQPPFPNLISMKTLRKTSNSFAWQIGLGGNVKLTDNLTLNASAKMQVINNVKMHYNKAEPELTNPYKRSDPRKVKKTLGIGVFSLGLNYSFPI